MNGGGEKSAIRTINNFGFCEPSSEFFRIHPSDWWCMGEVAVSGHGSGFRRNALGVWMSGFGWYASWSEAKRRYTEGLLCEQRMEVSEAMIFRNAKQGNRGFQAEVLQLVVGQP